MVVHARVKAGRLLVNEATDLPDGSVVELVSIEDTLSAEESAALDASITRGLAQADRGEVIPAIVALTRLRGT